MEHRHEARSVRGLTRQLAGGAQQEDVVGRQLLGLQRRQRIALAVLVRVEAVDRRYVDAVVGPAGVENVDDVVARVVAVAAERVDVVGIGVGLAVERQRVPRIEDRHAVDQRDLYRHPGDRVDVRGHRRGDRRRILQVVDHEAVFTVVAGDGRMR